METFFIPTEDDFRKWVNDAIKECLPKLIPNLTFEKPGEESLLSRSEVSKMFKISTMTLNAWMRKGLPHYRQSRRVFFLKSEIMEFLRIQKKKTTF